MRLAVWTFLGLLVYVFYGYRNSRLHRSAHERIPSAQLADEDQRNPPDLQGR